MLWPSCRSTVRRGGDDSQRGTGGIGFEVRKLSDEESGGGGASAGRDRRAWHRGSFGGRGYEWRQYFTERVQALSMRREAAHPDGPLRVAGRRRSGRDRHPAARLQRPLADDSGTGPLHRGIAQAQCHERRRHRRPVVAQQVLGEHAAGSDGGDERGGAGETLQRRVSGLPLHVHLAAVHAHERRPQTGRRRLRGGAGRQEAQRAGNRTTGAWIFSRTGFVSRDDPARTRGPGSGLVPASARGPGWLQRVRTRAAQGSGDYAQVPPAGDGEKPRPAVEDTGVLRAGASADRRDLEPGARLFRGDEETA